MVAINKKSKHSIVNIGQVYNKNRELKHRFQVLLNIILCYHMLELQSSVFNHKCSCPLLSDCTEHLKTASTSTC